MCFSAEASFAVGGTLIPAAAYCVRSAWVKNPRLIPVAIIPLACAVQQIAEGFVWHGLLHEDAAETRIASLVFLFFALAFWPFWYAFLTAILETRPVRKRLFIVLATLTTAWFWVLFFPLVVGPESLLSVQIVHHSIYYSYFDLAVYQYIPRNVLRVLYLLSVVVPMFFGQQLFGWLPGVVLLASVVVAGALFNYAFISVWCFFAAVLTTYTCVLFYRLPARQPAT
jgi:hypothetical protein